MEALTYELLTYLTTGAFLWGFFAGILEDDKKDKGKIRPSSLSLMILGWPFVIIAFGAFALTKAFFHKPNQPKTDWEDFL